MDRIVGFGPTDRGSIPRRAVSFRIFLTQKDLYTPFVSLLSMKKEILLLLFGVILSASVFAIPEPSSSYCEEMGYKYEFSGGKGTCVFSDGQNCDAAAFYNGSCGRNYRKVLACAAAGQSPGVARECCEGLKVISKTEYANGLCREVVGSYGVCSNCGNGNCEAWENVCNCEDDCAASGNASSGSKESNLTQSQLRNQNQERARVKAFGESNLSSQNKTSWKAKVEFVPWQKRNESECPEGCFCRGAVVSCETEDGRIMNITAGRSGNVIVVEVNKTNFETNLSIETEFVPTLNQTRIRAKLHNGEAKELKVMPDEALQRVLERLRLRYCNQTNDENNCALRLKEASKGEIKQAMYEIQVERHARILGIFSKKMRVNAEVDPETGEVSLKKPWWAFIASEPSE